MAPFLIVVVVGIAAVRLVESVEEVVDPRFAAIDAVLKLQGRYGRRPLLPGSSIIADTESQLDEFVKIDTHDLAPPPPYAPSYGGNFLGRSRYNPESSAVRLDENYAKPGRPLENKSAKKSSRLNKLADRRDKPRKGENSYDDSEKVDEDQVGFRMLDEKTDDDADKKDDAGDNSEDKGKVESGKKDDSGTKSVVSGNVKEVDEEEADERDAAVKSKKLIPLLPVYAPQVVPPNFRLSKDNRWSGPSSSSSSSSEEKKKVAAPESTVDSDAGSNVGAGKVKIMSPKPKQINIRY